MQSQQLRYRKKYPSFLLSSLCHGLLLFLAFFARYNQSDKPVAETHPPAQIRWQSPVGKLPIQPQQTAPQPTALPQTAVQAAEPLPTPVVDERAHPVQEDARMPLQVTQQPSLQPSSTKSSLTAAAFMNSFMSAAQELRRERAEQQAPSHESPQAAFIAKEQKAWSQLHYRERIMEAIGKASRFRSRSIHHTESIDTVAQLTVPILKDGSLGDMSRYPFSGIQEVDRYLRDILTSADFPPIPKRFNTDIFLFTIPITISIKKGSNVYYLSVH